MTNLITERILIVKNLQPFYKWEGKSPKRKGILLKRNADIDYGLIVFLLSLLIIVSAMVLFKIDSYLILWKNPGLLILMIMAMSLSIRAPHLYIELLLQKHIGKIQNSQIQFDQKQNKELNNIIESFNKRKKYKYLIGIPQILISISALMQFANVNAYWDKFPLIVFVISTFLMVRINYDVIKLRRNLKSVETANEETREPTKC